MRKSILTLVLIISHQQLKTKTWGLLIITIAFSRKGWLYKNSIQNNSTQCIHLSHESSALSILRHTTYWYYLQKIQLNGSIQILFYTTYCDFDIRLFMIFLKVIFSLNVKVKDLIVIFWSYKALYKWSLYHFQNPIPTNYYMCIAFNVLKLRIRHDKDLKTKEHYSLATEGIIWENQI